jgi:2-oxoglutarate dehydrogenase E2 component (dihydrolipoamide succinyltransferase)
LKLTIDVKVPTLGESITEATVAAWLKKVGDAVAQDEPIASLETDKVAVELTAPAAGVLMAIAAEEGTTVLVGAVVAKIDDSVRVKVLPPKSLTAAAPPVTITAPVQAVNVSADATASADLTAMGPAVRRMLEQFNLDPSSIAVTGNDGRLTKEDVLRAIETGTAKTLGKTVSVSLEKSSSIRQEERIKMSRLRQTIARRLKDAQNTAAMLTTFNDVDMSAVMAARERYRDLFEKKHGVRLGFMGFFVKAACMALKEVPATNAFIDGDEIVFHNYVDVSVAVSTPTGLVTPVLRNADTLSVALIEKTIADFGKRARDGKIKLEELQGGTFSITNGGVFGSLMSTPILNAPQSAILGMHRIEERAVVRDGAIVIRPMMYLALSYDHRVIDGREAVTALVRIKEALEDPTRLALDM